MHFREWQRQDTTGLQVIAVGEDYHAEYKVKFAIFVEYCKSMNYAK